MTKPSSFFNYAFLSLSVLYWNQFTTASIITVEYFDVYCYSVDFAVGVPSSTCIQHDSSSSVMFDCGSSGLIMYEYPSSTTCSSTPTQSTITTATDTGICEDSSYFLSNPYFADTNSFRVTCDASEDWLDNGDYYTKRTTSVLQASSAIDYTQENCNQNDDSSCPATVEYGYSYYCITDPTTYMSYYYSTSSENVGYLYVYSDSYCYNYYSYSELPYNECLDCSRFSEKVDEIHLNAGSVAAAVIIIIVISVVCCCCVLIAVIIICCFPAILAGIVAFLCCRKQQQQQVQQSTVPFQPVPQQQYGNQPYGNQQYGNQQYVQPQGGYAGGPPPNMEMISIQIPMNAKPGQMITVSKSNGQQVNVQLPNNAVPGSVIQVQG